MTTTITAPAVTRAISGNFAGADSTITDPETGESFFACFETHPDTDGSDWQLVITSVSRAEQCSDEQEALERAHGAAATALGYGEFNSDRIQRGMILTGSAPFDGYVSTWLATPPAVGVEQLRRQLQQQCDLDVPMLKEPARHYPWISDRIPALVLNAITKEMLEHVTFGKCDWPESHVRYMGRWSSVVSAAEAALREMYCQGQESVEALIASYGIARALEHTPRPTLTREKIDLYDVFDAVIDRLASECASAVANHAADALFTDALFTDKV